MRVGWVLAFFGVAGCTLPTGHQITPQDVANAQGCYSQVLMLATGAQAQVPACMSLAATIKAEGSP
jgi:hypothetical protein